MGRLRHLSGKGVGLGHFRYIQTDLKLFKLVNRPLYRERLVDLCILILGVFFNQVADIPIALSSAESNETLKTEQPGQVTTKIPPSKEHTSTAAMSPTPLASTYAGKMQLSVL